MGNLTHTVSGGIASFRSAARVPIENLKCHFLPVQEGSGDPSPENVRPISGWQGCNIYKTGKNIGHVIGYSASTVNSISGNRQLVGNYGTTISTINYTLPDTALTITQSQWPNTSLYRAYTNGYFCIAFDNLVFNQSYDISFKVTNITNNPLNAELKHININSPGGGTRSPTEIKDNILIFKNVEWVRHSVSANRCTMDIYNCGMSFTLSEFMITPTEMNDGIWEPYRGEQIPITFPNVSKNLFEVTPLSYDDWTGEGYLNYYLDNMNPIIDTTNKTISITCRGSGDSILYKKTHYAPGTYTFSYDMTYSGSNYTAKRIVIMCFKADGTIMTNEEVSIPNFTWNKYYKGFYNTPRDFTVPKNVDYFTICFGIAGDTRDETATFSNIQLEVGTAATTYEPYSFNNTVYGGYIDIAAGELVKEYETYTFTGSSNDIITMYSDAYEFKGMIRSVFNASVLDRIVENNSGLSTYASNALYTANSGANSHDLLFYVGTPTHQVAFYINKELCEGSVESFCDWLSENPIQLVYKLKTPIHYPLFQQNLKALLDNNNVWSNTNDITEVSYQIHDSNMIKEAKMKMAAENSTHYKKVIWNQIDGPVDATGWQPYIADYTTVSYENGIASCEVVNPQYGGYSVSLRNKVYPNVSLDRKYYASYMINSGYDGKYGLEFAGGQQFYGNYFSPKDTWVRNSFLVEGRRNGSGAMYMPFPQVASYPIDANPTFKLKAPIYIDLTQMFGAGNEPTTVYEFEGLCKYNNIDLEQFYPQNTAGTPMTWVIPKRRKVIWNQRCPSIDNSMYWKSQNTNYTSIGFAQDMLIIRILQDIPDGQNYVGSVTVQNMGGISWDTSHYYYYQQDINPSVTSYYINILGNGWKGTTACPADTWTTMKHINISGDTTNSGTIYAGYPSTLLSAGTLVKVRRPIQVDLTLMFGAGNEPKTVEEFEAICNKNCLDLSRSQALNYYGTEQLWII